jgi:glycosyltransferase involved in cell wall biosynthesis
MKFILYSGVDEGSIRDQLGRSEYSYFFVLKGFQAALGDLGDVVVVQHPQTEVDAIYDACAARGEPCVFLSFTPPQNTPIDLRCPTVVVLAWEFDTIPTETWDDEPRNDWRVVLSKLGRAICLSSYSARAIKAAMGEDFPVAVIAAPVGFPDLPPAPDGVELHMRGTIYDSGNMGFRADLLVPAVRPEPIDPDAAEKPPAEILPYDDVPLYPGVSALIAPVTIDRMPAPDPPRPGGRLARARRLLISRLEQSRDGLRRAIFGADGADSANDSPVAVAELSESPPPDPDERVHLQGVVYTALLNPLSGRKNWLDLLTAFIITFREVEDATLVLKMVNPNRGTYHDALILGVSQLAPFKCRLIVLHGYLETEEYQKLISITRYYVSSARAEGLCLPLMEFMACGRPAVTPLHTAMEDYVHADAAFIVRTSPEHAIWPHDPRLVFRTVYFRMDWESLCEQLAESYRVAKTRPDQYQAMAGHAIERIRAFGSVETVREQLRSFFGLPSRENGTVEPTPSGQLAIEPAAS